MKGTDGILFGDIHSYRDFHLILSRAEISPAKPKTTYKDIPGGDGSLDLTNVHGEVKYYDRDAKFTFTMHPSGDLSDSAWEAKKTEISNAINGMEFKITLDRDSAYFYEGRCVVDSYASDRRIRSIVISAKLKPYKLKQDETVLTYDLSETAATKSIENARKTVIPSIEVSDNCTIEFNGISVPLESGTYKVLDVQFVKGINVVKLSGSGSVVFRYREGDL